MWEESEKEFLFELYNWKLKKKKANSKNTRTSAVWKDAQSVLIMIKSI